MSKQTLPLPVRDISAFAKALSAQLRAQDDTPSHLALMNMLARSAGYRNFQHLRAAHTAGERLDRPAVAEPVDHKLVARTLEQFDAGGRLRQWPSRRAVQDLALWALWARLPAATTMQEKEVNDRLRALHLFDDPAILRRSLFTQRLVSRNTDGSDYRRLEQRPPPEARALIRHLATRQPA